MGSETNIVIASATRTPIGAFNGNFSSLAAHELGSTAITAALSQAYVKPEEVSEVVFVAHAIQHRPYASALSVLPQMRIEMRKLEIGHRDH